MDTPSGRIARIAMKTKPSLPLSRVRHDIEQRVANRMHHAKLSHTCLKDEPVTAAAIKGGDRKAFRNVYRYRTRSARLDLAYKHHAVWYVSMYVD